jgi:hypothetical protein
MGGVLEAADLPPTMMLGAHRLDDEMLRIQEYSPGESTAAVAFDPERFAAHEKCFVQDLRRWAHCGSTSRRLLTEPPYSVSRRVRSSRSPWGFERRDDAERFLADLRERFAQFSLVLHPEKTRLIEFGRFAAERRGRRGLGKPETFDFLGFTHICAKTRNGRFTLKRVTIKKRMAAKLSEALS